MRLSKLTRFAAPLVLLSASAPSAWGDFTFDTFTDSVPSSVGPLTTLTSENIYHTHLWCNTDQVFASYVLSSAGALSGVSRNLALTYAGDTLFSCNTKTTCPGNNDNIAIHVTIVRVNQYEARALVEYNDRQNGGSTGVSTNYTTHLTNVDLYNNNYNLVLQAGSTGPYAAPGDVTHLWSSFMTDSCY